MLRCNLSPLVEIPVNQETRREVISDYATLVRHGVCTPASMIRFLALLPPGPKLLDGVLTGPWSPRVNRG